MLSRINSRNIRDLGGMVSTDGRRIKEGLLIRSAFLRMLDEEQIEYLDSLNIKYILDLRSTEEAESNNLR